MKVYTSLILLAALLCGCQNEGSWSAEQLREWHFEQRSNSKFVTPLYYRGSDDNFHYFMCRSLDSWVSVKVQNEQINILDVRTILTSSQSENFPGYYIVDPQNNYRKVPEPQW